ncbi:hypothetical protein Vadar_009638 [Vaccinium darrowii]|uniref:Uncharacterized protein n=1 Tax=Vaccinium darrowii TaxID=229202 RepID=A0ACB7XHI8_9ERIC|nr:hypothetical protein Vadar_009638 [Vaccinium darrowii]
MEAVVEREEEIEDEQERKVDTTLFPQLGKLQLNNLPNLRRFCHFTHTLELPMLSELDIWHCPSMYAFSMGHVSTPNLSLPDVSWNGDLNNALPLLQEKREKVETAVKEFIRRLKARMEKRNQQVADVHCQYENGIEDYIYEPSEDSDEMDLDSYHYESYGSIERNNRAINWRETLPPNPQRGRCICFRTADLYMGKSVITRFYSVPFDFLGDGGDDDDVNSSNPDVEGLKRFYECTNFATTSTLSSVGSSLFVVGGSMETGPCKVSITTEKMYRFDTAASENDWYNWEELSMHTPRAFPITVAMDGKLYIFGGSGPDDPLAEMFNPELSTFESLPPPPSFPIDGWRHLVVAALQPSKKILVASGLSDVVSVYNVVTGVWEELNHKVDFSSVRGQAAVVQNGNALCWCSNNVEEVHAYHLVHKRWFKSPIKGLDNVSMRDPDGTDYCPIFPLDDNHLCLLWKDHMGYDGTNLRLLHCIKIRVSMAQCGSRFDAVVVAFRSYALGRHESIFDANVFFREGDEGRERGRGRGGHDNGGRTGEPSDYGGGRQSVSSTPPCAKCWRIGHMECGCDQVGSGGDTYG